MLGLYFSSARGGYPYYSPLATVTDAGGISEMLPPAKLGGFIMVGQYNGKNYLQVSDLSKIGTSPAPIYYHMAVITPMQAVALDTKLDDGKPDTGMVTARYNGQTPPTAGMYSTNPADWATLAQIGSPTTLVCRNTAGTVYNDGGSKADQNSCEIRFSGVF